MSRTALAPRLSEPTAYSVGPEPGTGFRSPPASHRGDTPVGSDPFQSSEKTFAWSNAPTTMCDISRASPVGVSGATLAFLVSFRMGSVLAPTFASVISAGPVSEIVLGGLASVCLGVSYPHACYSGGSMSSDANPLIYLP